MDDDWDPLAELSRWDLLVVRWSIWWQSWWSRYCGACDVLHRPWNRTHRSCRCGLSRPDTWGQETRDAFHAVVEAAIAEEEKRG